MTRKIVPESLIRVPVGCPGLCGSGATARGGVVEAGGVDPEPVEGGDGAGGGVTTLLTLTVIWEELVLPAMSWAVTRMV